MRHRQPLLLGPLQDTTYGDTFLDGFRYDSSNRYQIVNINRNHWVLLAFDPNSCVVTVFDSFMPYQHKFQRHIKRLAHELFHSTLLEYGVCQQQLNGCDCGLHALVNYEALSRGIHPSQVYFPVGTRVRADIERMLKSNTITAFSTVPSST